MSIMGCWFAASRPCHIFAHPVLLSVLGICCPNGLVICISMLGLVGVGCRFFVCFCLSFLLFALLYHTVESKCG
ncbi:hypothetical protein HOY80DRAFT_987132 [Tuber brumale]|nr:hypothetical protein HOY80DRAFT_987132 [Tuber brumale]